MLNFGELLLMFFVQGFSHQTTSTSGWKEQLAGMKSLICACCSFTAEDANIVSVG